MSDLSDRYGPGFTDAEYAALHAREVRELRERVDTLVELHAIDRAAVASAHAELVKAEAKIAELEVENAALKRGEFICERCGLRKNAEFERGDF